MSGPGCPPTSPDTPDTRRGWPRTPPAPSPPGTDPEESILNAFKLFDPAGTGTVNKDE